MKNWLFLTCAVLCEVAGSMALKQAEQNKLWFILTLLADGVAFWILSILLRRGMGLSVVYGIWGAMGVALTAALGTLLFHEPFTWVMGLGVALVIGGVLLVEYGSDDQEGRTQGQGQERSQGDVGREAGVGGSAASSTGEVSR